MKDCTMFVGAHPLASPFVVAIILVAAATAWLCRSTDGKFRPSWPMGSGTWDFTASWASNITAGAAILSAIMAGTGTALPDRPDYLALSLFFVAIAVAAPCVFNFVRKPTVNGPSTKLIGFAGMFLLAAVLTTWAAYGQLLVFALVVKEAASGDKLVSAAFAAPLYAVAALIAITLVPYIVQTVYANVGLQREKSLRVESASAPTPWSLP